MLDRACGALDPAVGVSAARFMGLWLRALQPGEAELIPRISEIGFDALRRSIFPNVRTAAILALLQQLDRLSEEQAEELLWVASSFDDEMRSVVWSDENAWLHRDWLADLQRSRRKSSAEAVARAIARLKVFQTAAEVSGQEADAVNTAYLHHDEPMPDADVLFALMNREEVFIRADAAQVLMSSACAEGERLRQRVFEDEHPLVLSRAVLAAFEHWRSYSSAAKADLRLRIRAALSDPAVAAISSRWLFDLGDEHSEHHNISWPPWNENEKRDLWSLWADAMGAALRTLGPRRFLMNSGDFANSTRAASQWLTPEEACRFAEAWMEWIEEQTKLRSLDDYETSIAKFLLDTTQAQPALREDLTVRALRLIETEALAHSLGAFVDRWRALAGRERKAVWRLLRSARKDVEWLRAVVLTQVEPPPELICLIASRPDFFQLPPVEQIATLPAPLLAKCLQLLTGPAGWGTAFGIPIRARIVWERILNVQLSGLDQPHFVLAVTHLIYNAAQRADLEQALVEQWTALCDAADEATSAILFRELLNVSLKVSHSWLGPLWKAFFAVVIREDERTRYVEEIVKNLEGLSYSHKAWRELVELFGREFFLNEILKHSMGDYVMYNLVLAVSTPNESDELAPRSLELINAVYQTSGPRIFANSRGDCYVARSNGHRGEPSDGREGK